MRGGVGRGQVFFKPTALGTVSSTVTVVRNLVRIPVCYRVQLPPRHRRVLEVSPAAGVLKGRCAGTGERRQFSRGEYAARVPG